MDELVIKNREAYIALVGNPNSGKTSVFNAFTGLRQKVANYPGVTVEKKTGLLTRDNGMRMIEGKNAQICEACIRVLAGSLDGER